MIITEVPYDKVLTLRQSVMYPDKDIDFVKLPDDGKGIHIGYYEDDKLVSVMSIFMGDGKEIQFRKLATQQDKQKKGYASALMKWLMDYAKDVKLSRVWCNARVNATGFYKNFGFVETDQVFSQNGYDYVVMEHRFQ